MVETFGTEHVARSLIRRLVAENFDLRPGAFRQYLDLHRPIYEKTAAYGHFGRRDADFTWEATDKAALLREAAGLPAARMESVSSRSISSARRAVSGGGRPWNSSSS